MIAAAEGNSNKREREEEPTRARERRIDDARAGEGRAAHDEDRETTLAIRPSEVHGIAPVLCKIVSIISSTPTFNPTGGELDYFFAFAAALTSCSTRSVNGTLFFRAASNAATKV